MKRKNVFSLRLLGATAILSIAALSCNNNDTNDSSTVTTDTSTSTVMATDTSMSKPADTTTTVATNPPATGMAKPNPAKKGMKGKVTITPAPPMVKTTEAKMEPDASGVYTNTETMAAFPGGNDALQKFFNNNLEYPSEATNEGVEGTVTLSFIVDEKGKISSPQVVGGNLGYGLDEEAIRVLKNMPKWTPAKVKGNNVKTRLSLPVRFVLE